MLRDTFLVHADREKRKAHLCKTKTAEGRPPRKFSVERVIQPNGLCPRRQSKECRARRLRESYWKELDGFEAEFAVLFGAGFADPDDTTLNGIQFIVAGDDLDELTSLQPETAAEAEAALRTVNDKAGNTLGV